MTVATPVLEELGWRDIPALAALERTLFPDDSWSEPTWWAELALRPARRYAVLRDSPGGQILGYAGLALAGETADVMTVAVAPDAQGRGLGHLLLDWLVAQAQAAGASYLLLEVRDDNAPARALYAGHGFSEIARRRRYYQPGDVDALVLRRTLGEQG